MEVTRKWLTMGDGVADHQLRKEGGDEVSLTEMTVLF